MKPNRQDAPNILLRSRDLENSLDFDGNIARQRSCANRGTRMTAGIAENVDKEIGCAITNLGLLSESRHSVDEHRHFHAALDPIKIAARGGLELRERIDCTKARCRLAFFCR